MFGLGGTGTGTKGPEDDTTGLVGLATGVDETRGTADGHATTDPIDPTSPDDDDDSVDTGDDGR